MGNSALIVGLFVLVLVTLLTFFSPDIHTICHCRKDDACPPCEGERETLGSGRPERPAPMPAPISGAASLENSVAKQYAVSEDLGSQDDNTLAKLNLQSGTKKLCDDDRKRIQRVHESSEWSTSEAFMVVMSPVQMGCSSLKAIGGQWVDKCWDGAKYVCFDDIGPGQAPCLIYSFGISTDTTFEEIMMEYGCTIHAYDHTITDRTASRAKPQRNFFIHKMGIDVQSSETFTTLEEEFSKYGHTNSIITYLKIDIEGSERTTLLKWAKNGLLRNVLQIGVEFHQFQAYKKVYKEIFEALYEAGFKLISFDPNLTVSPGMLLQYFELVFRKTDLTGCRDL